MTAIPLLRLVVSLYSLAFCGFNVDVTRFSFERAYDFLETFVSNCFPALPLDLSGL